MTTKIPSAFGAGVMAAATVFAGATIMSLFISGCAMIARMPPLPAQMPERALVRDLARIVDSREQLGWFIDEIEIDAALEDALNSVCRADDATRRRAMGWIGAEILAVGGPVENAYAERGYDLGAVDTLLLLTRTQKLLNATDWRVRSGGCPFWIFRDEDFRGLQDDFRKMVLSVEGGGRFYGGFEGQDLGYGGGGSGRALAGYGLGDRFTLLAGAEVGGVARFSGLLAETRSQLPTFVVVVAVPAVARFYYLSQYVEGELGPMAYYNEARKTWQPGLRFGVSAGIVQPRVRGIGPGVALSLTYDAAPARSSQVPVHQLSGGIKATFSLGL